MQPLQKLFETGFFTSVNYRLGCRQALGRLAPDGRRCYRHNPKGPAILIRRTIPERSRRGGATADIEEYLRSALQVLRGKVKGVSREMRIRPGTNITDVIVTFH